MVSATVRSAIRPAGRAAFPAPPEAAQDPAVTLTLDGLAGRVVCGDCVKVMAAMEPESVDLIVTDPPYIVRFKDRSGRSYPNDDNDHWLAPAYRAMHRVLKNNSFCVSFYGWPKAERFLAAMKAAGFAPVGHLSFVKRYASNARPKFVRFSHENAYLLAKGEPRPCEVLFDVREFRYTGNAHHPTQKPVSALKPLIEAYSRPGDIVLDPFAGSGSTLLAAQLLGRRSIGIELVPQYVEAARWRLEHAKVEHNHSIQHQ